jgi:hypothetical protein
VARQLTASAPSNMMAVTQAILLTASTAAVPVACSVPVPMAAAEVLRFPVLAVAAAQTAAPLANVRH